MSSTIPEELTVVISTIVELGVSDNLVMSWVTPLDPWWLPVIPLYLFVLGGVDFIHFKVYV